MPVLEPREDTRERERSSSSRNKEGVRNVATYQQSIRALYRGRSVTLIATGDLAGHSQVCQFIDEDGKINWASESDFDVIDPTVMPLSTETLQHILAQVERSR